MNNNNEQFNNNNNEIDNKEILDANIKKMKKIYENNLNKNVIIRSNFFKKFERIVKRTNNNIYETINIFDLGI